MEGFIVSTIVILPMFWETFSGFVLGYVYCLSCCFHDFSHQLSLTRFIPRCSMVLDVDSDAYRRASEADAELGAFIYL